LSSDGAAVAGTAEAITVTAANLTGPLTVTMESVSGPGVSWSPTTVAPAPGELVKLSSATWAAAGTAQVRGTAPGGIVSNTLTVAVSAAPPSPPTSADWATISTGPGVVWAHRITTQNEIDAFVTSPAAGAGHAGAALLPSLVPDQALGSAMRFLALGGVLAQALPASGGVGPRPVVLETAHLWPDPAVHGEYYVHTCRPNGGQTNNLWLVTAKNANTLTVTYVASTGQPFSTTQQDWAVGDHIGHQSSALWTRLFSALKADSNGLGVDDINNAGKLLRSTNDQTNFPHGTQAFGYGWYGHPDEQAAFPTWRPSDHGAFPIDSILRSNVWDGDEFHLLFRYRVDPIFHTRATAIDQTSTDGRFGRKMWMLQAEMTVPQQITGGYGPSNRFWIPSTPDLPFTMSAYSFSGGLAGRRLAANLDGSGSYQPGSAFAATALPSSDLPAGSAYEVPAGEWISVMLRVKPGKRWESSNPSATGVRDTIVQAWLARENDTAWTQVFSMTDQALVYGSSGPDENVWRTALPGFNAIALTGYLNIDLGNVPPKRAYYADFAQVALSTAAFPCPQPPVWAWPFAKGTPLTITDVSTNLLDDTASNGTEAFTLDKVLSDWCSATLVRFKNGAGVVTDFMYVIGIGAGHSGTDTNDGSYAWRASTGLMERLIAPTKLTPAVTSNPTYGENDIVGRPGSQHAYSHVKGLDSDEPNGPAFMQVYGTAIEQGASKSGQAHRLALSGTPTWTRFGDVGPVSTVDVDAVVKDTIRRKFFRFPCDAGTAYHSLDYTNSSATWQSHTQTARPVGLGSGVQPSVFIHDPVRDLYIGGRHIGTPGNRFHALDAANPGGAWVELTFTGTGPTGVWGQGLMYRPAFDDFLLVDCSTSPPTGVWRLVPPAGDWRTQAWTWSRWAFTGTSSFMNRVSPNTDSYERWQYSPELNAVLVCPDSAAQMEAWWLPTN
jgi:hypothetical protein